MNLVEFENRYLELFFQRQRYQWENYVLGLTHDLNVVDHAMFRLVKSFPDHRLPAGRRGEVLNAIVTRELVDKHPDVSRLRNRLDDWDNYCAGTADSEGWRDWKYRIELASKMKSDVLELMSRRNDLSRDLGFRSYVDLVLDSEDMKLEPLLGFLKSYVDRNLEDVRTQVMTHQLSLRSWFAHLQNLGKVDPGSDPNETISALLARLGMMDLQNRISVFVRDQGIARYVGAISVPHDVRVLVRPCQSLDSQLTLFHELGHAVAHASNMGIF